MFCRSMLIIVVAAAHLRPATGCPNFQYQWSWYSVGLLDEQQQTWLDVKRVCEYSRGYLASMTTADEVTAVLEYMNNSYPDGIYAIGLSRQAGLFRNVSANWKWETGEEFDSAIIPWTTQYPEPSESNNVYCGVRINTVDSALRDLSATRYLNYNSDGYICESDSLLYFQSVEDRGVAMDVAYMRCALRCRRQKECHGFHLDDAGCQIETNRDNKRQYSKIVYCYG